MAPIGWPRLEEGRHPALLGVELQSGSTASRAANSRLKASWKQTIPAISWTALCAIMIRKYDATVPSAPATIHGRRRPKREVVRSLIAPASRLAKLAVIEPRMATWLSTTAYWPDR